MKKFVSFLVLVGLVSLLSACQAFLEDYNYSPIGTPSSSGYGY